MNAARAYRRLKEVEAKKLANRLALLEGELARSKQKIKETKTRTKAVKEHQRKIAMRLQQREKKRRGVVERSHAQIHTKARISSELHRQKNREEIAEAKRLQAQRVHDERKQNKALMQAQRKAEQQRAIKMRRRIQQQRKEGAMKRAKAEQRRKAEAKRIFDEKVRREAAKSLEAEKQVKMMEQEELRLIAELEKTQEIQRNTYNDLEEAVRTTRHLASKNSSRQRQKRLEEREHRTNRMARLSRQRIGRSRATSAR